MATCAWEGCPNEAKISYYERGGFYQRKYCDDHLTASKRKKADGPITKIDPRRGHVLRKVDGRWVAEHRLVMEEQLGRKLKPFETVWHKNDDPSDNSPENLEIRITNFPKDLVCPHCGESYA